MKFYKNGYRVSVRAFFGIGLGYYKQSMKMNPIYNFLIGFIKITIIKIK